MILKMGEVQEGVGFNLRNNSDHLRRRVWRMKRVGNQPVRQVAWRAREWRKEEISPAYQQSIFHTYWNVPKKLRRE